MAFSRFRRASDLALAGLIAVTAACAPTEGGDKDPVDAGPVVYGTCTGNVFENADVSRSFMTDDEGHAVILNSGSIYDRLDVRIAPSVAPGLYDLSAVGQDDGFDILVGRRCAEGNCDEFYVPTEGGIEVTNVVKGGGDAFTFSFSHVQFGQVNSPTDRTASGDQSFCADGVAFDSFVPASLYDTVPNITMQNCATEQDENLYDIIGDAETVFVVAVTGWCSFCKTWVPEVVERFESVSENTGKVIFVMGENQFRNEPSLDYCREYADGYGEDGTRWYKDFDRSAFPATFSAFEIDFDAFGYPWNAIMTGPLDNYAYYYSTAGADPAAMSALNERL